MARPQVAVGADGLQIWKVAANILNKQSRTANKGWSSSLGVGRGAFKVLTLKIYLVTNIHMKPGKLKNFLGGCTVGSFSGRAQLRK
jgi:hypothetical protein